MAAKGQPKTGGRKPGSPNKITRDLRNLFQSVLETPSEDGTTSEQRLREMMESPDLDERKLFWQGAYKLIPNAVEAKVEDKRVVKVVDLSSGRKDEE